MLGLKVGSKGKVVEDLQRIIGADPDGVFGTKETLPLLKKFQKNAGLAQTGYVDGPTYAMLIKEQDREVPGASLGQRLKIGFIRGHNSSAQGANLHEDAGGASEYKFNGEVIALAIEHAKSLPGVTAQEFLRKPGKNEIATAYAAAVKAGCDVLIEVHFNAANGQARGTETLCSVSGDDREFAAIIQSSMCKALGRTKAQDRGVKVAPARGGLSTRQFPNGPNCLVESGFGDNLADAKLMIKLKAELAASWVDGSVAWAKKVGLVQ